MNQIAIRWIWFVKSCRVDQEILCFSSKCFYSRLSSAAVGSVFWRLESTWHETHEDVDSQNDITENEFGAKMIHKVTEDDNSSSISQEEYSLLASQRNGLILQEVIPHTDMRPSIIKWHEFIAHQSTLYWLVKEAASFFKKWFQTQTCDYLSSNDMSSSIIY